eukprot:CAMPEP_0195308426 /NCGR_PEP_ID=MMETSP0707-20130614/38219_1 /TAXON_ID=33640 /ORGANISM="Asterionellopsis glacialis, Strain CCMP134" /LENGTH=389 /DNA_ID=CAMNT_0040372693 /DNA_START=136 /DNA_END=1305 /DNA_ORIENTATION=+
MPSLWNKIISHSIAATVGAVALLCYYKANENKNENQENDGNTHKKGITMKVGPPFSPTIPFKIFRPNQSLEIAFDTRTRNPVYVLEHLKIHKNEKKENDTPRYRFTEESSLPPEFRSRNGYYKHSGYDRGHLAPAADFSMGRERKDAYTLTNASPQVPSMNRKVWANLEAFVRQVAATANNNDDCDDDTNNQNNIRRAPLETYVLTGPLWIPVTQIPNKQEFQYQYTAIGIPPSLISVPTHFFKVVVVYCPVKKVIVEFAAFVVPNATEDKKTNSHYDQDFTQYLVRWSDLEKVTGIHFFPSLVDDTFKKTADILTEDVWHRNSSLVTISAKKQKKTSQSSLLLPSTDKSNNNDSSTNSTADKKLQKKLRNTTSLQHICKNGCSTTRQN